MTGLYQGTTLQLATFAIPPVRIEDYRLPATETVEQKMEGVVMDNYGNPMFADLPEKDRKPIAEWVDRLECILLDMAIPMANINVRGRR